MNKAWIETTTTNNTFFITLKGCWRAIYLNKIETLAREIDLSSSERCIVRLEKIEDIDMTGAWFIWSFLKQLKQSGISFEYKGAKQTLLTLWTELEEIDIPANTKQLKQNFIQKWLLERGKNSEIAFKNFIGLIAFLGHIILTIGHIFKNFKTLRLTSLTVFLDRSALQALPLVGIISFLLGVILIYQGAFQLRRFGAEIYAIDLLAISMLREVGVLLTAIIAAGRSGSAFAAQIGTMKLNQEIAAMQTLGLDPLQILVLPRLFALLLALPLLAFYSDIMGLIGGAFMARFTMGISFDQFTNQLGQAFSNWSFWIGIIKAPFFAVIIALIGCYEGLQVSEGAESVGLHTTQSVVKAIFMVIVFNALFSVLFTYIGV